MLDSRPAGDDDVEEGLAVDAEEFLVAGGRDEELHEGWVAGPDAVSGSGTGMHGISDQTGVFSGGKPGFPLEALFLPAITEDDGRRPTLQSQPH